MEYRSRAPPSTTSVIAALLRYTGASVGYQLASPLAGGLAPLIATALLTLSGGKPWPVALYLIALSAVTLVSVYLAAETHRVTLEGDDQEVDKR